MRLVTCLSASSFPGEWVVPLWGCQSPTSASAGAAGNSGALLRSQAGVRQRLCPPVHLAGMGGFRLCSGLSLPGAFPEHKAWAEVRATVAVACWSLMKCAHLHTWAHPSHG